MGNLNNTTHNEPLHAGEIFHLWSYLHATKEYLVTLQVLNNHTGDEDLKAFLDDVTENSFTHEEQQVESLLKETGIRLPPAPPDRPNVELHDIPAGARFNDPEITLQVKQQLIIGRMLCSYMMGIALREDIVEMFDEFHGQKAEYENKLLKIIKEKGWIVLPPLNIK